jgi:protoporphyrinogen oxidase
MASTHYLILGAGPAGLAFAHRLLERGVRDFLVVEKEDVAGGLCRSADVDGSPLDVGGGHFIDVRRPAVTEFLFRFMPEGEWNLFERKSLIRLGSRMIGSPIEANVWQLDEAMQRRYLADIAAAGCNAGTPMPASFVEWIVWKLGRSIAEDYMLPYNRKMFGDDLDALGTYWLEKLPNVSYEDTLRSCRERRPFGSQPGHTAFRYPKAYGSGELWRRMGEALGDRLLAGTEVRELDIAGRAARLVDGSVLRADAIVNTVPWPAFERIAGLSPKSRDAIASLRHTGIHVDYRSDPFDSDAHWIYEPDPAVPEHRYLLRANFAPGSRGYWTETRIGRRGPAAGPRFEMPWAYPLNTIGKNEMMARLLAECAGHRVFGLGRWGEWQHYNSDVVVEKALAMADAIA